jgi:hypothetical protein
MKTIARTKAAKPASLSWQHISTIVQQQKRTASFAGRAFLIEQKKPCCCEEQHYTLHSIKTLPLQARQKWGKRCK